MKSRLLSAADPPESSFRVTGLDQKHLWGGIAIVVALLILLIILLYMCFKKKFKLGHKHRGKLDAEKLVLREFHYEELQKATNNFSTDCMLGKGAFGNVYLGTFEAEEMLAIKVLHPSACTSIEEFQNEVVLISKVKHRNLVGLIGFCKPGDISNQREAIFAYDTIDTSFHCFSDLKRSKGRKILVYEYVSNGSLLDHILGLGGRCLTWRQRVTIAIGAAKGIAHLHEGIKPSIIHRDLKPSNILLGEGFEAKVSDFGLVKSGPIDDRSHVSSQVKGTPGYLDPAYVSSNHLSPFTDVYSFGVILLQLVCARPAVTTKGKANIHIIDWARENLEGGRVEEIVDANLLFQECNMEMMLRMGQLGLRCVVPEPKKRPSMTQIWRELEAAYQSTVAFIPREPSLDIQPIVGEFPPTTDQDRNNLISRGSFSQTSFSIDGIGLQKFHVEMDSLSFQSASLRCLEADSISIDVAASDLSGIAEDTDSKMAQKVKQKRYYFHS